MKNETYTVYGDISSIPVEDLKQAARDALENSGIEEQTLDVATYLQGDSLETLDRVNYYIHDEHLTICTNAEGLKAYLLDDWGADPDPHNVELSPEVLEGIASLLESNLYEDRPFPTVVCSEKAVQEAIDEVRV